MLVSLLSSFYLCLVILVSVSFYTLSERKVLSLSHIRQGPVFISVFGIFQPFSDGLKLFTKSFLELTASHALMYSLTPFIFITWAFSASCLLPLQFGSLSLEFTPLSFLVLITLGLFPLLLVGFSSNSPWPLIGVLRGVAQSVSFEVSASFLLLSLFWLVSSFSFQAATSVLATSPVFLLAAPLSAGWVLSCLAEGNRTPFDFSEAESELVSGFNIEFGSGWFAVIFIAEYFVLLFMCLFSVSLFLNSWSMSFASSIMCCFLLFLFVWVRSTLPRTRYDKLMSLAWFVLLPVSIFWLLLSSWVGI